ncbi:MAG: hypothetical protein KBT04_03825, partial [Bacteroidales bacterium]|nr:hypothetical protein [Candidatus Colimorpha onthohippi]
YNDSISTIPAATIAAVDAIKDVDTLIVGGYDRGIDYQPLALYLLQSQINNIAFVGRAGRRILNEYQTLIPPEVEHRNILINNDFETIVAWCYQHTKAGGACLLSPAAASYDAFKNFEERGSLFEQFVKQYGNQ